MQTLKIKLAAVAGAVVLAAGMPAAWACTACGARPEQKADAPVPVLEAQSVCPVMGGAINRELYVDHEGKRIYVCCPPCINRVRADPAAAIAKLTEKGQAPAQALCPVTRKPIDPKFHVDHAGRRIYVCGADCVGKVRAEPDKALAVLRQQGVGPERVAAPPDAE